MNDLKLKTKGNAMTTSNISKPLFRSFHGQLVISKFRLLYSICNSYYCKLVARVWSRMQCKLFLKDITQPWGLVTQHATQMLLVCLFSAKHCSKTIRWPFVDTKNSVFLILGSVALHERKSYNNEVFAFSHGQRGIYIYIYIYIYI